jgi:hypothetical protein
MAGEAPEVVVMAVMSLEMAVFHSWMMYRVAHWVCLSTMVLEIPLAVWLQLSLQAAA